MLPRTIKRVSTATMWIGVGLVVTGALLPALAPSVVEGAPPSAAAKVRSTSPDNRNPDQILVDEAAEVRRRVAEFRERTRAEDEHVDLSRVFCLAGAFLALGGLVGRFVSGRREPAVEPH